MTNYLVFTGFCIIASIFSHKFILIMGEKVLKEVKEAKRISQKAFHETEENKKMVDTLIDADINPEEIPKNLSQDVKNEINCQ